MYIPFHNEFWPQIERGEKTATTRNQRYGKVGDVLDWGDPTNPRKLRLTAVERVPLAWVGDNAFREEGFADRAGFVQAWCGIHPGAGWTPEKRVWFHRFVFVPAGNCKPVGGEGGERA